jgi:hypothetical protein
MVTTQGTARRRARQRGSGAPAARKVPWGPGLTALLTIAVLAGSGSVPTPGDISSAVASTTRVRIAASDSIWSVASAHRPPGMSTAQAVDVIRRLNGLGPRDVLRPGQVIVAPSTEAVVSQVALR